MTTATKEKDEAATKEAGRLSVEVLADNLKKAVAMAVRAVDGRSTLPIVGTLRLSTDRGRLLVEATNLDIVIRAWAGAKVESEGAACVDAKQFHAFIRTLPDAAVALTLEADGRLQVVCARTKADFATMKAEDYPRIPDLSAEEAAEFDWPVLTNLIQLTSFSAAREDNRPVLTGIEFDGREGHLAAAGADGFRLSVIDLEEVKWAPGRAIVPAYVLAALAKCTPPDGPVELRVSKPVTQVSFATDQWEVISSLIQGTFPNFRQLIPDGHLATVTADRDELLAAVKTVAVAAAEGSDILRLGLRDGDLRVSSHGDKSDCEAACMAETEGDTAGFKIAFNSRYLQEAVTAFPKGSKVTLRWSSSASQGVMVSEQVPGFTHVLMPMFVQW